MWCKWQKNLSGDSFPIGDLFPGIRNCSPGARNAIKAAQSFIFLTKNKKEVRENILKTMVFLNKRNINLMKLKNKITTAPSFTCFCGWWDKIILQKHQLEKSCLLLRTILTWTVT